MFVWLYCVKSYIRIHCKILLANVVRSYDDYCCYRINFICDEIGTSPSNAIRMFVSAFNRRGGFPFDPSNPYEFDAETLAAMDDAVVGRNLSGPYRSVKEAMDALNKE